MKQLHHVIKRTILRHTKIVKEDRMRRGQHGRGLRFTLKSAFDHFTLSGIVKTQYLWLNQLDSRRPHEQSVFGSPDFTHASAAQQLHQLVATHLTSFRNIRPEAVNKARQNDRENGAHQVRKEREKEKERSRWRLTIRIRGRHDRYGPHKRGSQRCQSRLTQSIWDHQNEKGNPERDSARAEVHGFICEESRSLHHSDAEGSDHFEQQPDIEHELGVHFTTSSQTKD